MTPTEHASPPGMTWLFFAAMTVGCWGLYGVFLHSGQAAMNDPVNGRYKAFLWVGIAYFLTAVLAPLLLLVARGATWSFPKNGIWWSLIAGILGAIGAFAVLLAFGAKGTPAIVMSIVFAGAPVVNAAYSLIQHPPAGGWSKLPLPFLLGIALAATGGFLVTLYKPVSAAPQRVGQPAISAKPDSRLAENVPVAVSKQVAGTPTHP